MEGGAFYNYSKAFDNVVAKNANRFSTIPPIYRYRTGAQDIIDDLGIINKTKIRIPKVLNRVRERSIWTETRQFFGRLWNNPLNSIKEINDKSKLIFNGGLDIVRNSVVKAQTFITNVFPSNQTYGTLKNAFRIIPQTARAFPKLGLFGAVATVAVIADVVINNRISGLYYDDTLKMISMGETNNISLPPLFYSIFRDNHPIFWQETQEKVREYFLYYKDKFPTRLKNTNKLHQLIIARATSMKNTVLLNYIPRLEDRILFLLRSTSQETILESDKAIMSIMFLYEFMEDKIKIYRDLSDSIKRATQTLNNNKGLLEFSPFDVKIKLFNLNNDLSRNIIAIYNNYIRKINKNYEGSMRQPIFDAPDDFYTQGFIQIGVIALWNKYFRIRGVEELGEKYSDWDQILSVYEEFEITDHYKSEINNINNKDKIPAIFIMKSEQDIPKEKITEENTREFQIYREIGKEIKKELKEEVLNQNNSYLSALQYIGIGAIGTSVYLASNLNKRKRIT